MDNCEFLTIFKNILLNEKNVYSSILVPGEMNINILGTNLVGNEYLDMLSMCGFKSYNNVYT